MKPIRPRTAAVLILSLATVCLFAPVNSSFARKHDTDDDSSQGSDQDNSQDQGNGKGRGKDRGDRQNPYGGGSSDYAPRKRSPYDTDTTGGGNAYKPTKRSDTDTGSGGTQQDSIKSRHSDVEKSSEKDYNRSKTDDGTSKSDSISRSKSSDVEKNSNRSNSETGNSKSESISRSKSSDVDKERSKTSDGTSKSESRSKSSDFEKNVDKTNKHGETEKSVERSSSKATLKEKTTDNGYEKTTSSGVVREKVEKRSDGEHKQVFSETGRKERDEVKRSDGSVQKSYYSSTGKVTRQEVVQKDGSKEVTNNQIGRSGDVRAKETVKYDSKQKIVSKTVTKNITINKTVNKTVVVNHYRTGRYGFVYHPVYRPRIFVAWYDPFWYTPAGVVIFHPFHYSWGWESYGWYHCYHGPYWASYEVYPAPSYWVTDFVVAGYLADHYEAQESIADARADAAAAREDAERARRSAEEARDEAEIAEAKAAAAQAELRAKNAEDKAARLERDEQTRAQLGDKPNPNATPIDKDTKEQLKNQVEATIAEKKQYADQAEKGQEPALPDVSKALAEPNHIFPVSKTISVTSAKDSSPAGNLSEGDLLKVEPGQEEKLKKITALDLVTMRVMTSKGEDGEVTAGTLVNVPVKDLQEFDNEFRAKIDTGLDEAEKNQDTFKQAASAK